MLKTLSPRLLIMIAVVALVLHAVPLMVIASVRSVEVNWFYLSLTSLLSLGIVFYALWMVFALQLQRKRQSNRVNHFVHELKSPLTAVTVGLEGLKDVAIRNTPSLADEYLNVSLTELERMVYMVENNLRLLNYDQPGFALQIQRIRLEKIVKRAKDAILLQARERGAVVDVSIDGADYHVRGDRMHLTNALVNLLDNALKFSGKKAHIQLRLYREEMDAVIEVQDNGIGIDEAFQTDIFEQHFRIPAKAVAKVKGHGLGLHYVSWVVRRHQGTVGVKSSKGNGSVFWIRLPLVES